MKTAELIKRLEELDGTEGNEEEATELVKDIIDRAATGDSEALYFVFWKLYNEPEEQEARRLNNAGL